MTGVSLLKIEYKRGLLICVISLFVSHCRNSNQERRYFMKNSMKMRMSVIHAVILCSALVLLLHAGAEARSVVTVEGAAFDVSVSMKDNLKVYMGKDVVVHLRSGKTLEGYVKSIGNDFVHLEKLAGKDFYDALIRIDDISAIEARFRQLK
jgi:hypothetical protein